MPPVPPASRSPKGPGGVTKPTATTPDDRRSRGAAVDKNVRQQGRQGNVQQNVKQGSARKSDRG
jgi:hypothetical protein